MPWTILNSWNIFVRLGVVKGVVDLHGGFVMMSYWFWYCSHHMFEICLAIDLARVLLSRLMLVLMLRSWGVEELRNWGVEELRNWGVEELRWWGVEETRRWGVEELRNWEAEGLRSYVLTLCTYNNRNNLPHKVILVSRQPTTIE